MPPSGRTQDYPRDSISLRVMLMTVPRGATLTSLAKEELACRGALNEVGRLAEVREFANDPRGHESAT
jgi:hypothetical protein